MKATPLAEAATLGSLLLDSAVVDSVAAWLRASDFADPWHAEVYAVIRERHVARQPSDVVNVGRHLLDRLGSHRADPVRLMDLVQAAPIRADSRRYGAMVLESSLRRELAEQGVLLRAAALSAALARECRPVTTATAMVDAALAAGERRWQAACAGETSSAQQPRNSREPVLRNMDRALAADRLLRSHADLNPAEVREREQRLVVALIAHPKQVPGIARWLGPDALTDRPWRAVYAAILDLVEHGAPVDVVTVAWQVQHASRRLGPGPEPAILARAVDADAHEDPGHLGSLVAGDLVRRTADSAARALTAAAANPGIDVRDLFETGRLLSGSVRAAAAALPGPGEGQAAHRDLQAVRSRPVPVTAPALVGPVAR